MPRRPLLVLLAVLACQRPTDPQRVPPPAGGVAAAALVSASLASTPSTAATQPQSEPKPRAQLTATMEQCEGIGCEIAITFSHPVSTATIPQVDLEPKLSGRFRWDSPLRLVFAPDKPLDQGESVFVTIRALRSVAPEVDGLKDWTQSVTCSELMIAGKVVSWPRVRGLPRLVTPLTVGDQFGPDGLLLVFDQPVKMRQLRRTLSATTESGEALKLELGRPESVAKIYGAPLDLALVVRVRPTPLPSPGTRIVVSLPSWEYAGPRPAAATEQRIFELAAPLQLSSVRFVDPAAESEAPSDRLPLDVRFELEASNPLAPDTARAALKISPEPMTRSDSQWGSQVSIALTLAPGQKYRFRIASLEDVFGQRVRQGDVEAVTRDLDPALGAPHLPVLVERGAARLPLRHTNLSSVTATLFPVTPAQLIRGFLDERPGCDGEPAGPPISTRLRAALNAKALTDLKLGRAHGLFCVKLTGEGRGSQANGPLEAQALVQVADLSATVKRTRQGVFAFVTRLSDASPVPRARLEVLGSGGEVLASGTADAEGMANLVLQSPAAEAMRASPAFVVARFKGEVSITALDDERLSQPWQFALPAEDPEAPPLAAAIFTDRGAYRPGEKVHLKVMARDRSAGPVEVEVTDPRGQGVLSQSLALDRFGQANLDVPLRQAAPVGAYAIRAKQAGRSTSRGFRVEEYRVPNFEVKVAAAGAWTPGSPFTASVVGRYLHGGAMSGREVRWTVFREPEVFAPRGLAGFIFAPPQRAESTQVADGAGKLDGDGHLALTFTPSLPAQTGPARFVIEATVTDVDRQTSTGRASQVLHPLPHYVGLRPPPTEVLSLGSSLSVPVVVVAPGGKPLEGVAVSVELRQIEYHSSVRLTGSGGSATSSDAVAKQAASCQVISAEAPVSCSFPLAAAGRFEVVATAGAASVSAPFTVAGEATAAWPRFDHARIDLVADRPSYKVGETARLVAQSPFTSARGLLTIETGGVLQHRTFEIEGSTPALEVPITEAMVPNAFVSVVLLRGRLHHDRDATGFETGAPAFKVGYAELKVDPSAHRLRVEVQPSTSIVRPRGKLELAIQVRDAAGKPVQGQATVAVVDEAVLGLTAHRTPDPVAELMVRRGLGVRTADSRLDLVHVRRARREELFPGGDGSDEASLRPLAGDLRTLFQSTAYWNPKVAIGRDGTGAVTLTLPDNLTTYRVMVVAGDAAERAGSAETKVTVRKPLMVKPALPRFAYPGDQFALEAVVFNGSGKDGTVELTAEQLEGLQPASGAARSMSARLAAGGSASLRIPVEVVGRKSGTVRFAARMGDEEDRVEVALPILDPGVRRTVVASTQVARSGSLELAVPAERQPGTAELEVVLSASALTELKDSVEYLMGYPNGCIEQTTSTAYPLVVLKDLLPDMGVSVDEAKLKEYSEAGIKRLLSFQTTSGGLAYWPGSDQPHVFGTTFGATALLEGKKRGFDVPDLALGRMADYLEKALREGTISRDMPHGAMADGDTRALIVLTLNRMGRPQPGYVSTLWRERAALTAFGLSMLATTVSEGGGDQSLIPPMLAEVRRQAKESEREAWYEGQRDSGWSMGSPLRTHAAALLAYAAAGRRSDAGPKLLAGLLKRKTGYGIWGNTQENVYGVMGVAALVGSGGGPSTSAVPDGALSVAGQQVALGAAEKVGPRVLRYTAGEAQLGLQAGQPRALKVAFERGGGGAPVTLTARARYEVPLTPESRQPAAQGFTVSRRYESLEGKSIDGTPIPLGSVVRVRVGVKSAERRHYVAIEDKLPAGLEPLNANLATTEKLSMGPLTPETQAGLAALSYQEMRDARVAFYANELPAGTFEYVYLARATTPGRFLRPAAAAEAMYAPEVLGRSQIDEVVVR